MPPQQIGKYTVLEEIASGGQGAVYRAYDPSTGMIVAVKVLHAHYSADESFVERFRREAMLIQAIDHENVVKIYDVGESDGLYFMALEFIPETLSKLIEVTGKLPSERAVAMAIGICDGIGQAHLQGIVHRDIKHQNVLLTPEGIPKVTDFGIARSEMLSTMTATGAMMGTPYYMSPEQAEGKRADSRSDVYSLGCLLYQLLSGEVPFSGDTPLAILRKHVDEPHTPIKTVEPSVTEAVASCVEKAMEKDPSKRFEDSNVFATALRQAMPQATADISESGAGVPESTDIPTRDRTPASGSSQPGSRPASPPPDDSRPTRPSSPQANEPARKSSLLPVAAVIAIVAGAGPLIGTSESLQCNLGLVDCAITAVPDGQPTVALATSPTTAVPATTAEAPQIVERTVIVEVKGDEVVVERTVIDEREVEVIVDRTVIVEREVEVIVDRTVVVTKAGIPVTVIVVATPEPEEATFFGLPFPVVPTDVGTAPEPKSSSGSVVVRGSLELRGSGVPGDSSGGMFNSQSVTEKLFMTDKGGNAINMVAESWDLATDLSSLTVILKQGVEFHGGFGELTAADVAWAINMGNPGFNPESITDGGANWINFLGSNEVIAVDTYTVTFTIANFDPRWSTFILGQSGLGLSITSKKAFDEMGESWVRDNVIGTGPFKIDNYSRDDVLELSAVEGHYRITPEVKKLTFRAIPDDAVAEAALKTGTVDVSDAAFRNMTALQKAGFVVVGAGAGRFHSISFSGNYWERTHYITGEPLPSSFGNGTFNDSPWMARNDGEHEEEMENARLVRTALSLAIDRELISEVLFAGAAWPNYVYGADINNPNWQDKWATPYDPVLAGQLLDQAGYPKDSSGIRFEMPFFIRIGRGDEGISTAVVGMWRELGIDVQDWKAQYQTYRPNLVGRTAVAPWIHSAGAGSPQAPWDWPVMGNSECSRGRGGFNIGIEIRELCEFFVAMSAEGDLAKRIELRNANVEFLAFWMPVIGTIARPNVALINPNKIASWDMPLSVREAALHHPEFIKLK